MSVVNFPDITVIFVPISFHFFNFRFYFIIIFKPLAAEFFCYPPLGMEIIFYIPLPGMEFFFHSYRLAQSCW